MVHFIAPYALFIKKVSQSKDIQKAKELVKEYLDEKIFLLRFLG